MTHNKQPSENSVCNIFSSIKVLRVTEQICVRMLQTPAQVLSYEPAVEHSLPWQAPTKANMTQTIPTKHDSPSSRTHLALVVFSGANRAMCRFVS